MLPPHSKPKSRNCVWLILIRCKKSRVHCFEFSFAPCRIFNYVTRVTLTETRTLCTVSLACCMMFGRDINCTQDLRINYWSQWRKPQRNKKNSEPSESSKRHRKISNYRSSQLLCVAHTIPYKLFTWAQQNQRRSFFLYCCFAHRRSATFLFTIFGLISLHNRNGSRASTANL